MCDVVKTFPGVKALNHAQLKLKPGTVHALMGENGAGKSTLMKCMFGIYHMDEGKVIYEGQEVQIKGPLDALNRGIDVGAKYEIYCIIAEMAKQGKSIIMISSEMSELIGMSDRIMVMCDGRCTGFIDGDKANQENIMTLATQFE